MSSTEQAAPRFSGIEDWPSEDLAAALLETQLAAVAAAGAARPALATAIDACAARLARGGRLIYLGAGTSGRLAVLDAAELPPTFDWPPERAVALMAGGPAAVTNAVEGAEDSESEAPAALDALGLSDADVVIGVAASGRTPFVLAGIAHARRIGALTLGVTSAPEAALAGAAEIALVAETGAEIIAGSTRMKAGTAQKVLLNCLSTGVMIRLGYVHRGRMVEMRPTNVKLRARAVAMVADLTGENLVAAETALDAGGTIKRAVVMLTLRLDAKAAEARLQAAGGMLGKALTG
ncbi:N-acetylmuramic acid 6-phosphate etherase [Rhodobacter sp. NTK016B]|uniref:N-acetylmuramic acid 6-phosphate etherase n=1 Tax=Rhodobacter sp. NTK016B TaxID=2759676 RepID=UPI001A8D7B5A|nr:N-acetylmuramic acid 6-phosphate etherase [Rhodobacter sp. NTK016B]MBN8293663.1 N-acetylmuramic acid 6-phosphate etherase [Rhodobacter sp. NTK016B]